MASAKENTIRGSAVYQNIRDKQLELQEQFLASQLLVIGASRRVDDLREESGPTAASPASQGPASSTQMSARNRHALRDEIKRTLQQRRAIEAELTHVGALLGRAVADRQRLARRIPTHSKVFPEYQRIRIQHDESLQQLERMTNDCELRARGRRRLLKERPRQALLSRLAQRKFGTPEYRFGSLARVIDQILADWCDYRTYRAVLDGSDPESLADGEKIQALEDKLQGLGKRLARLECSMAEEMGLNRLLDHGSELGSRRCELLTQLRHLDRILEKKVEQSGVGLAPATDPKDSAAETVDKDLEERPAVTLRTMIGGAEVELKQRCRESLSLGYQLVRLSHLQTTFLERDFESVRSRFDDSVDLAALLDSHEEQTLETANLAALQHFVREDPSGVVAVKGARKIAQWEASFSAGGGY